MQASPTRIYVKAFDEQTVQLAGKGRPLASETR